MGGETERVIYRTDNRAIEEMKKQKEETEQRYKEILERQTQIINEMKRESERRDQENIKMWNQYLMTQQKNEENRQKELQRLSELQREDQKRIAEMMKQNQENFLKMFNSQNSKELDNYKKNIKEMEERIKDLQEKNNQIENQRKKEHIELLNNLNEKIRNAKDEAQRQYYEKIKQEERQRKVKEDKTFQEFTNLRKEYIEKQYKRIMETFYKNELYFCKEEIESFDLDKIKKFIMNVLNNEEADEIVLDNLKYHIKAIISKSSSIVDHLNILILGPSGVGKSTLINAIYKENICKTGEGKPCTQGEPKYYSSNKSEGSEKYIRLADSRGIEKGEYGVQQVLNSAKQFIQYYLKNNNPDEFVHLIWYCITGTRFEDVEKNSLIELCKLYTDNNLPIIVVYTMAWNEEQIPKIREEILKMGIKANFHEIVAKELKGKRSQCNAFGVEELVKISIEKAKNAIGSSCNTALRENCSNNITSIIVSKAEKINEIIKAKIENEIKGIEIGTDLGKMSNIIGKILFFIFLEYLNLKGKGLKEQTKEIISNFVRYYFEEILKLYQNKLQEIVNQESQLIANYIMNLQIEVNQRNNGNFNIKQQLDKETIIQNEHDNLFNTMKDLAECFCMKNAARFIWKPVNELLKDFLSIKYQKFIESNNELKEKFEEYAQRAFNEIGNNLKNI